MLAADVSSIDPQHDDFYQDFRRKVRAWLEGKGQGYKYADILLVGPDLFHLLCRLILDPRVSVSQKAKLATTIAYFVSPIDLLPEALMGPVGYIDDIALSAYVLNGLLKSTSPSVLREHWAGEGDVLVVLERVLEVADGALISGLWRRLKSLVDRSFPR
jgi:uncharacterized membrane protein YkvA (DUF1232 family)